ncbi:hypothetical protein BC739_006941 [Kutzneria viridogrisea]|nr:hypothetical protein [Kutzneria albida]MBA8929723.1 hypothetical protein [Kutzneria viridogrisea]
MPQSHLVHMPGVRYFLDTEFTDLPWAPRSELLWVALVDETGQREFSAVNKDCSLDQASAFVCEHVLPKLANAPLRLSRARLAQAVIEFVGPAPKFWAWFPSVANIAAMAGSAGAARLHERFADWDYQLLRGLLGAVPADWPPACRDLHALADATGIDLPPNTEPHNPLADARWGRTVWLSAQGLLSRA